MFGWFIDLFGLLRERNGALVLALAITLAAAPQLCLAVRLGRESFYVRYEFVRFLVVDKKFPAAGHQLERRWSYMVILRQLGC